jgi:SAM-dependent methyltransferase
MDEIFPLKFAIEESDMEAPAVERGLLRLWQNGQMKLYGNNIIEFGCNESDCARVLSKYNYVFGIDIRPYQVNPYGSEDRLVEVPESFKFCQADASNLTIVESYFDIGISISAIEHFGFGFYGSDKDENADITAMANMWNSIKPGGVCLITVPITWKDETYVDLEYIRRYTKNDLKKRIIQDNILQRFEIITVPNCSDYVGGAKAFETYDFSDIRYDANIYLEMVKVGKNE